MREFERMCDMKSITDTLLVSIDLAIDVNNAVLLVGRKKPGQAVDIINAFQGEEATEIYKLLTTKVDGSK